MTNTKYKTKWILTLPALLATTILAFAGPVNAQEESSDPGPPEPAEPGVNDPESTEPGTSEVVESEDPEAAAVDLDETPEASTSEEAEIEPASETKSEVISTETEVSAEEEEITAKEALKNKPKFKVGARLYGLWEMSDTDYEPQGTYETDEPLHEFSVNMARIKFSWTQWEIVEAVLKLDANQLINGASDTALLRDLYVRIQPLTWLGVKMGQFKRPFSRIEMRSRRNLPSINRGLVNDYAVEHLMYGDRDIGLTIGGRLSEKINLDYTIGIFNGMGMNAKDLGVSGFKDLAARVDMKPAKWLWLGFSGSFKFIEEENLENFVDLDVISNLEPEEYPDNYTDPTNQELTLYEFKEQHEWMTGAAWMGGMDLRLKFGDFNLIADGMIGENWWFKEQPYLWGTSLILSYKHKLKKGWPIWVEPVVVGEVLTLLTDWELWRNRLWQLAPGVNLHVGKYVRVMIGGEFSFAEGTEADIDGSRNEGLMPNEWPGMFVDSKRLLVQLAFSI